VKEPEKVEEPVVTTDQPEVLAVTQPSTFAVEQAAKQILETSEIKPLPDVLPDVLVTPISVEEKRPEPKLAQPLAHPVSKPRVVQKVAEAKPVEKPVEKKEEPKPVEKKPEPKKEEPKKPEPTPDKLVTEKTPEKKKPVKKKVVQRDGNANDNFIKGRDTAKAKDGASQDASQGNSKKKLKGNAALTNYAGIVDKKIDRVTGRVKVGARGQAVVTFTINANGSVSNLRIKKSSGKPAIDKGAMDVIRKSAPFPQIPDGRKTFSAQKTIAFTGK
jgi:protein TonB